MASHRLTWPLLLATALLPGLGAGQEPTKSDAAPAQVAPSPSPAPPTDTKAGEPAQPPPVAQPQPAAPPQPAAASPPAPAPSAEPADSCKPMAGDVCITAARQETLSEKHMRFTGFVDVRFGDARLQADDLDSYLRPKPDGTLSQHIVAHGSVVFLRGEERLSGDSLEMDLDTGVGVFENATGYAQPGIFIEAKKIERLSADTYRIYEGRFSSCSQPNPRWQFGSSSAKLQVDDKVKARNVVFRVWNVPVFYFPYFIYPIQEDQRSSGFLIPHYGNDTIRGRNFGGAFFWAMGRSADQTFALDYYSEWGWGFGHDLRYVRRGGSRGSFRSFFNRRQEEAGVAWDHDLNWNAQQQLPGKVRASVYVLETSSQQFQQNFQNDPESYYNRRRTRSLNLQRSFKLANVQLLADSNETFFYGEQQVLERLPSLTVTGLPKKHRPTGLVFSYGVRGERLARFASNEQTQTEEVHSAYSRFDLKPTLARPLSIPFLQVTPQITLRATHYGVSYGISDEDPNEVTTDLTGPPVDRLYGEGRVDIQGPIFSRIFVTPGNFYSDRFKHVISPQLSWTYRSRVDNFLRIPFFDGEDRAPGTNQLFYGLVQRFYSKRPGRSGKPETWEFLNWTIGQTYYVDVAASIYDPGYASAAFGPGGAPAHYSPIQTRLRFRPSSRLDVGSNLEYDVNYKVVKNLGFTLRADSQYVGLTVHWARSNIPEQAARFPPYETLRGDIRLNLPKHFTLTSGAYYRVNEKRLDSFFARGHYAVQCCGLVAEVARVQIGTGVFTWRRTFSIELANIGSSGSFLGAQPMPGSAGRGFP